MLCLSRNGLLSAAGTGLTSLPNGLRPCAAHLLNGGASRTTTALPSSAVDLPVRSLPFIFFGKPGVSIDASTSSSLRSVGRSTWPPPPLSAGDAASARAASHPDWNRHILHEALPAHAEVLRQVAAKDGSVMAPHPMKNAEATGALRAAARNLLLRPALRAPRACDRLRTVIY
jgi:hypothetical protein